MYVCIYTHTNAGQYVDHILKLIAQASNLYDIFLFRRCIAHHKFRRTLGHQSMLPAKLYS